LSSESSATREVSTFQGESAVLFETSVTIYQSTRRNDPENLNVNKTYTFQLSEFLQALSQNCEKRLQASLVIRDLTLRVFAITRFREKKP